MNDEKAARLAAIRAAKRAAAAEPSSPPMSAAAAATAPAPAPTPAPAASPLPDEETLDPAATIESLIQILLAIIIGTALAVVVLPLWLPGLRHSLLDPAPKAYWYLSRTSAMVAYVLLWFSMIMGLLISSKQARIWPGGPTALDLHQHSSLLGLGFGLFHAIILLGDNYIGYTLVQVLLPFASSGYSPVAVGLGQVTFYLMLLITLSFSVRRLIGRTWWKAIHMLSFSAFLLAMLHGIASGTDSSTWWAQAIYWVSGGSVLFLTIFRVLNTMLPPTRMGQSAT